jgi:hypothetical protein
MFHALVENALPQHRGRNENTPMSDFKEVESYDCAGRYGRK